MNANDFAKVFPTLDYWRNTHPDHAFHDWQFEVANNDTRLGYWDWVLARIDEGDAPE